MKDINKLCESLSSIATSLESIDSTLKKLINQESELPNLAGKIENGKMISGYLDNKNNFMTIEEAVKKFQEKKQIEEKSKKRSDKPESLDNVRKNGILQNFKLSKSCYCAYDLIPCDPNNGISARKLAEKMKITYTYATIILKKLYDYNFIDYNNYVGNERFWYRKYTQDINGVMEILKSKFIK